MVFDNLTSRMTLVTLAPAPQPSALADADVRLAAGKRGWRPPRWRWSPVCMRGPVVRGSCRGWSGRKHGQGPGDLPRGPHGGDGLRDLG